MLKKTAAFAVIFVLSMLPAAAAEPKPEPKPEPLQIKVESSCKSHLVHVNEPFEFIITASRPEKVRVDITAEGKPRQVVRVIPPARIPVTLPHPGFVLCKVFTSDRKVKPVYCGVGADPDQLHPLLPEPEDFDEFWANTKKELAAIPADFKMDKIGSDSVFNYYRISCANLNNQRAYGFLSLPVDTSKKLPLLVNFPGGEAYFFENAFKGYSYFRKMMGFDCARLVFHLPPYQPMKTKAEAKERHAKFLKEIGLRRYIYIHPGDRNKFYARTAVAGCIRLLDEALKQPGLDPDRVGYHGASHGGGFGLYLAAFSGKIKAAFCGVPNFGDRGGFLAGRFRPDSDGPEIDGKGRKNLKTLLYFDASYAARRITIPVMIGVGFTDVSCPPSGGYTIYNELKGPKMMFNKIHYGHSGGPPEYTPASYQWVAKHLTGK